ncbi:glucose-6-phosphate dehydrogenase [Paucibacter sp. O1-1]|uniref:glucose-6-phosphate dehydrogenase n=1 Tax=Roseateles TaxID=93681 RepID=UPI0010F884D4|nr:glucose-6-phosphate dehydrogenase [Paucibacter sp. M5-1]MCU7373540.1 glucose-6-phosphate dehydrogenase [Paucibacter sp. O1-1]MCZ7879832.1 glucose-6-phosphate dehydrogenase [Paucibacter sp. M5-1]MDA3828540.1 glucose-6-phosphate dehydrogenase [Paucibacter sp. O1-1]
MSFDLVFFGGTGDLTWRKLMPALFQAFRHGKLPEGGRILAVARDDMPDERYREWLKERFREVDGPKRPSDEEFERFAALLHYRRMDLSQPEHYQKLKDWLDERNADTVVLYLATSPHLFTQICEQLGVAGLNQPKVRVVLEKPLGHDLASAQQINKVVRSVFAEEQAFRIDHYLGKPSVQNLMALRFGNAFFEPLWRRESIANIQITLAESLGVGTRGPFYDGTGALRDMIQNHALQLLTMIAMEPPSTNDADAIRDEKLKVLRSLKPFTAESVARDVVRGQYRAGTVDGKAVVSYLDEGKIPADSATETFVALRTEVQNWRWAGVPFYLRTGKRLAARDAQIVVNFRQVPHPIFPGPNQPNRLVIKLQPEDGLELQLLATKGSGEALTPVSLDLDFDKAFAANRVGAYERLLLDAIAGRLNLFVRSDEQEQAWRWVEPILDAWKRDSAGPRTYTAGSWGPPAASALVARDGFTWAEEQ